MVEATEGVLATSTTTHHVCGACRTVRTQALFWNNKKFPNACFVDRTNPNYMYVLPALDAAGRYKVRR